MRKGQKFGVPENLDLALLPNEIWDDGVQPGIIARNRAIYEARIGTHTVTYKKLGELHSLSQSRIAQILRHIQFKIDRYLKN